jgi:hypothetical protein
MMASLDKSKFTYWLAGRLLATDWTAAALRRTMNQALYEHFARAPHLTRRVLDALAIKPSFSQLVKFLSQEPAYLRLLQRLSGYCGIERSSGRFSKMDQPPTGLVDVKVPALAAEADLAAWLDLAPGKLRWLADPAGRNRRHCTGPLRTYRYRWIAKRQGMPRLLEIPTPKLKLAQRKILAEILNAVPPHPSAHGFCVGRSILTNARPHCGKSIVLKFDLIDFFPSVSSARIFRIFRTLGYPSQVARLLAGLCTTRLPADVWDAQPGIGDGADFVARQRWITRHLPQGAPTSPALANLAATRLDRRFSRLAQACHATYTRYADDLTFSGGHDLARRVPRLKTLVAVIAADEGFALNFRKTQTLRAGACQHVTGLVVNVKPNIRRSDFDQLKAILTNCLRSGPDSQNRQNIPEWHAHLLGRIAQVASINPTRGKKLALIFEQINWV